ncbi:hypothetical protein [Rhodococcus pyridinivorans]
MNAVDLPPIPDPITGEPRPPRAPRIHHGTERTPTDRHPRKPPKTPEHLGPILEWLQPTFRDRYTEALFWAGVVIVDITLLEHGDLGWTHRWGAWAFILGVGWWIFHSIGTRWVAAGATWLQSRKTWVDTYHLTYVRFSGSGRTSALSLKDFHGNEIRSASIDEIQNNPDLWDLVYNGILHSVDSGECDVDQKTRRILRIPYELGPRTFGNRHTKGRHHWF